MEGHIDRAPEPLDSCAEMPRESTRAGGEETEAKVRGVAEAQRAANGFWENDAERSRRTPTSIVTTAAAKPFELYGPEFVFTYAMIVV